MLSHPWLQAQGAPDRPLDSVVMQRVAAFSAANQLRRAALVQVARSLPPTKVAGLRALFKAFDADGDGVLTPDELQAAVARFNGSAADGAELDTAVAAAASGSGADTPVTKGLDYDAFLAAAAPAAALTRHSALVDAFNVFDTDKSGALSVDEVKAALEASGIVGADAADILASADADGDGQIDLEEFEAFVRSTSAEVAVDSAQAARDRLQRVSAVAVARADAAAAGA